MKNKVGRDAMVPIKDVFMLDLENKLDAGTVKLV